MIQTTSVAAESPLKSRKRVAVAAACLLHLCVTNKPHRHRQLQVGMSLLAGRRTEGGLIKHDEILMQSPDLHLFSASSVSAPNNHPRSTTRSLSGAGASLPLFLSLASTSVG